MSDPGPIFFEHRTYRRRRLADLARLLPVAGLILMLVPLFWTETQVGDIVPTSFAIIFIFGVWFALVAAAALLSLTRPEEMVDMQPPRSRIPGADQR